MSKLRNDLNGRFIRQEGHSDIDDRIYLIDQGKKRHIPDVAELEDLFHDQPEEPDHWKLGITFLDTSEISEIESGHVIPAGTHLAQAEGGETIYMVEPKSDQHSQRIRAIQMSGGEKPHLASRADLVRHYYKVPRTASKLPGPASGDHFVVSEWEPITKLTIYSGEVLNGLQVTKGSKELPLVGGDGGGPDPLVLRHGEVITEVSGKTAEWFGDWSCVVRLLVKTNQRSLGKWGSMGDVDPGTKKDFTYVAPAGHHVSEIRGTRVGDDPHVVGELHVEFEPVPRGVTST